MKKMDRKLKSFTAHLDEQYGKKGTETREKYEEEIIGERERERSGQKKRDGVKDERNGGDREINRLKSDRERGERWREMEE